MCHGYYQKAAWVWKVTLHLPHEELECEKDRLMGLTQLSVSLQCLHWESLLSYQHHGMQACQSLLSYCSDHTGKKAAVFRNEVWCDCSCILHPVFVTFLAFLLPPPRKSWQDRGTNRHGAIPEMLRYLTGRTSQLGVTLSWSNHQKRLHSAFLAAGGQEAESQNGTPGSAALAKQ